jgi:hypothetical protein
MTFVDIDPGNKLRIFGTTAVLYAAGPLWNLGPDTGYIVLIPRLSGQYEDTSFRVVLLPYIYIYLLLGAESFLRS